MSRSRLEAFADGVFAIAATLLILNVDSQVGTEPHGLGGRLLHIWPSYVAYAVSFVTIGIIWVNHHALMQQPPSFPSRPAWWPSTFAPTGRGRRPWRTGSR